MTDQPEPEPIRCREPDCRWTTHGIADGDDDRRARILAQHRTHVHVASRWEPTTDQAVVFERLALLLESALHQPVAATKGRWLVRLAAYGGLWDRDRIGEVPEADRLGLRRVAADVARQVYPGGAYARSATAENVRSLAAAHRPA